jgi:hypothetical protein
MRTGERGCTADGYGFGGLLAFANSGHQMDGVSAGCGINCLIHHRHSQIVATRRGLSCSGDRIKPPQGGGTADGYGFGRWSQLQLRH